jgi:hypothetical protein
MDVTQHGVVVSGTPGQTLKSDFVQPQISTVCETSHRRRQFPASLGPVVRHATAQPVDSKPLPPQKANAILDCYEASTLPSFDALEFDAEIIAMAELLHSYVLSGQLPGQDCVRDLILRASQGNVPDDAGQRRRQLLDFMVQPAWTEWARCWAKDFSRLDLRELSLNFVTKLVQSSAAAGLGKAFLLKPVAGGILGLMSLVLPILRNGVAMYVHRNDATARAQLARLAQIFTCTTLLTLAASLGGWALLCKLGAGALSYVIGSALADILRDIWPMKLKNLSPQVTASDLVLTTCSNGAGMYGTQVLQEEFSRKAGASAFKLDEQGQVTGCYSFKAQALEALLEEIQVAVVTNVTAVIQYRSDRSKQHELRDPSGLRPVTGLGVRYEKPHLPTLLKIWKSFCGIDHANIARQTGGTYKSISKSMLETLAEQQQWSHGKRQLIPVMVALFQTLMNTAGLLSKERREDAGIDLECPTAGLDFNINVDTGRKAAMVPGDMCTVSMEYEIQRRCSISRVSARQASRKESAVSSEAGSDHF